MYTGQWHIWQQSAHTTYQLLAAQQEPHKKANLLKKRMKKKLFWKSGKWAIISRTHKHAQQQDRKSNRTW